MGSLMAYTQPFLHTLRPSIGATSGGVVTPSPQFSSFAAPIDYGWGLNTNSDQQATDTALRTASLDEVVARKGSHFREAVASGAGGLSSGASMSWTYFDGLMADSTARGLRVYANTRLSDVDNPDNFGSGWEANVSYRAGQFASRLKNNHDPQLVENWLLWNEPYNNLPSGMSLAAWAAIQVRMTQLAAAAIRTYLPSARIESPSTIKPDDLLLQPMLDAGITQYADAIGIHAYQSAMHWTNDAGVLNPSGLQNACGAALSAMPSGYPRRRLYVTEWGTAWDRAPARFQGSSAVQENWHIWFNMLGLLQVMSAASQGVFYSLWLSADANFNARLPYTSPTSFTERPFWLATRDYLMQPDLYHVRNFDGGFETPQITLGGSTKLWPWLVEFNPMDTTAGLSNPFLSWDDVRFVTGDAAGARTGTGYVEFLPTGKPRFARRGLTGLIPGNSYTFSVYAALDSGGGGQAEFQVDGYDPLVPDARTTAVLTTADGFYHPLTVTFTAQTRSCTIRLVNNGVNRARFDDVSFGPVLSSYDLIVNSIGWSPSSPAAGEQVTFSADVKNIGGTASPNDVIHGVQFQVDGAVKSWSDDQTTGIAAGATRTQTANGGLSGISYWTATEGTHTVRAEFDDVRRAGLSGEANKANNVLTATIVIPFGTFQGASVATAAELQTALNAISTGGPPEIRYTADLNLTSQIRWPAVPKVILRNAGSFVIKHPGTDGIRGLYGHGGGAGAGRQIEFYGVIVDGGWRNIQSESPNDDYAPWFFEHYAKATWINCRTQYSRRASLYCTDNDTVYIDGMQIYVSCRDGTWASGTRDYTAINCDIRYTCDDSLGCHVYENTTIDNRKIRVENNFMALCHGMRFLGGTNAPNEVLIQNNDVVLYGPYGVFHGWDSFVKEGYLQTHFNYVVRNNRWRYPQLPAVRGMGAQRTIHFRVPERQSGCTVTGNDMITLPAGATLDNLRATLDAVYPGKGLGSEPYGVFNKTGFLATNAALTPNNMGAYIVSLNATDTSANFFANNTGGLQTVQRALSE